MSDFEQFYADVPAAQRNALQGFREAHQQQQTTIGGMDWHYYDIGTGEQVILWLVGGLRVADAAYRSIPLMQDDYRIIAPDYPALDSMSALADGLAGLLEYLTIAHVNVLSGSFGGMLGQVFLRRHPKKVAKIILSTTAAPAAAMAERYQQQLTMIDSLEEGLLRDGAKMQMLETLAPPDEERAFWKAYLDELFTERLGKTDLLSTYRAMIDFMQQDSLAVNDLADFTGEILIFDSADDATFGQEVQQDLQAIYPQAQRHTFINAGHSPGSTHREEFFRRVREFFA